MYLKEPQKMYNVYKNFYKRYFHTFNKLPTFYATICDWLLTNSYMSLRAINGTFYQGSGPFARPYNGMASGDQVQTLATHFFI